LPCCNADEALNAAGLSKVLYGAGIVEDGRDCGFDGFVFTGGDMLKRRQRSMTTSKRLECSGTHAQNVSTRPRRPSSSGTRVYECAARLSSMVFVGSTKHSGAMMG
jgi:hypothetical protein